MEFTKEELIKWYNSKTETYSINPKTNRKINNDGPTYKKLDKEYSTLIKENKRDDNVEIDIKNIDIEENKNNNNIENKFVLYLELKDTKKIKIQKYKTLNTLEYKNGCSCDQKIEIKINCYSYIKKKLQIFVYISNICLFIIIIMMNHMIMKRIYLLNINYQIDFNI